MKKTTLLLTYVIIFTCILPIRYAQTQWKLKNSSLSLDEKLAKTDSLILAHVNSSSPGISVIVINEGEIILSKGYGMADLEENIPISTNTTFYLCSVSKQFTTMAIMMLSEKGKLNYNDRISRFFPELPSFGDNITVRHLLTHTSGLPDYFDSGASFPDITNHDVLNFAIHNNKLDFLPGEKYSYSNTSYVLLSMIVERASGMLFHSFMKKNIFDPLEMYDTRVYDSTKPVIKNRAKGYTRADEGYKPLDYNLLTAGGGGIYSTVEDLFKWDRSLYSEILVKKTTLREAFTPQVDIGDDRFYGFGWFIGRHCGLNTVSHSGSLLGFRTNILRFPEQRFSVIMLTNLAQLKPAEMSKEIAGLYLDNKMK